MPLENLPQPSANASANGSENTPSTSSAPSSPSTNVWDDVFNATQEVQNDGFDEYEGESGNGPEQPIAEGEPTPPVNTAEPQQPASDPNVLLQNQLMQQLLQQNRGQQGAMTAQERAQQMEGFRKNIADQLAQRYQLSEEDLVAFQERPQEVLPQFAAKVHMQAVGQMLGLMQAQLPNLIASTMQQHQSYATAKSDFFSKWPKLAAHEADVVRLAIMYRAMNQDATPEQAIDAVGRLAHAQLGIPVETQQASPSPSPPPRPPRSGSTGRTPTQPQGNQASNPFVELANQYLQAENS